MHPDQAPLGSRGSAFGAVLLGVFLLAAQLAPVAHLTTHRDDHAHGPARAHREHESPHHHDDAPAVPAGHEPDHGQASVAHFGLALIEGPPPPYLPPPAEALVRPADNTLSGRHAVPCPLPPARGPPRLA